MANFLSNPYPTVEPQTGTPDDYQRISVSPNAFGAQLGEATQRLGSSIEKASQVYYEHQRLLGEIHNQTVANAAQVQFGTGERKINYGDPADPKDTGYMGTEGGNALSKRKDAEDRMAQLREEVLAPLNPRQRIETEAEIRRMESAALNQIGAHAVRQSFKYGQDTQKAAFSLAQANAASAAARNDEIAYEVERHKARDAAVKGIEMSGMTDPASRGDALLQADSTTAKTAFDAKITAGNSRGALTFYKAHKSQFLQGDLNQVEPRVRAITADTDAERLAKGEVDSTEAGTGWATGIQFAKASPKAALTSPSDPITPQVKNGLHALQQEFGGFTLTSTTEGRHAERSQHYSGQAVDVRVKYMTPEQQANFIQSARRAGFTGIGLGETHIHLDMRPSADGSTLVFEDDYTGKVAGKDIAGWQAALNGIKANAAPAVPREGSGDTAAMLKSFEGFKPDAGWDKTHWRTGYGSDTVTRADGTVEEVTQGTKVTQEDADRDLQRRIPEFQAVIKKKIGDDVWQGLSAAAQASLTSVTYNYGHLPDSVATAAQSGDMKTLAQAVRSLSANPDRRAKEADNILGGASAGPPDRAAAVAMAMKMYPDDPLQQQATVAAVNRRYAAEAEVNQNFKVEMYKTVANSTQAALEGQIVPDLDEGAIRRALGPQAQTAIDEFHIARGVGEAMRGVQFASKEQARAIQKEIVEGHGVLSDVLRTHARSASTGPGVSGADADAASSAMYTRFKQAALNKFEAVMKQRDDVLFGPNADPAEYAAKAPTVKAALEAEKTKPAGSAAHPEVPLSVTASLAAQEQMGVSRDKARILTRGMAIQEAGHLMTPGTDVLGEIQKLQQVYGPAWTHVFGDMASMGKLSSSYQAVASLQDPNDAKLFAQALQQDPKEGLRDWDQALRVATGSKTAKTEIDDYVLVNPDLARFVHSMQAQGAGKNITDGIVKDVQLLAYAQTALRGEKNAHTAGDKAVQAFVGKYEFLPQGSGQARIPKSIFTDMTTYMDDAVHSIKPEMLAPPGTLGGFAQPKNEDWIAALKANPRWTNTQKSDGVNLRDSENRIVRGRDGQPFTLYFSDAPMVSPAQAAARGLRNLGKPPGMQEP